MKKYFRIWLKLTIVAAQVALASRFGAAIFTLGKLLRFAFFFFFLVVLTSKTKAIAGYSFWEVILFFLTFNIIDTMTQFLFREVYRFRSYVVNGDFDFILIKPLSPLFRSLFGGSDILDIPVLVMLFGLLFIAIGHVGSLSLIGIILYILLLINGIVIGLSFYIFVLCVGILTTEVDNAIMVFRDMTQMGRVPVDIYKQPLQWVITFIIPIGIMMSFPVHALMQLLSWQNLFLAMLLGGVFLASSLVFWQYALKKYTSASS